MSFLIQQEVKEASVVRGYLNFLNYFPFIFLEMSNNLFTFAKTYNMNVKIGSQVGNWEVVSERYKKDGIYVNDCVCICGTARPVPNWSLNNSKSKSCGCNNTKGRFKAKCVGDLSASYYTSFKHNRKTKGIEFSDDLNMGHLWYLYEQQGGRCAISGIPIPLNPQWSQQNKGRPTKIVQTASIDRIDNSKGYVPDNVQWVHKDINYMRGGLSIMEFIIFCRQVVKHNANVNISDIDFDRVQFSAKRQYFGSTGK